MGKNTDVPRIEKGGLGSFLKRAREQRSISLRYVSDCTKIRTYYLESLENSELDRLPSGPVGVGFVRAFADAIGVDADVVVTAYKQETSIERPSDVPEPASNSQPFRILPPYANRVLPIVSVVSILLLLLASGGFFWFVKGRTESFTDPLVKRVKIALVPGTNGQVRLESGRGKENNNNGANSTGREVGVVEGSEVSEEAGSAASAGSLQVYSNGEEGGISTKENATAAKKVALNVPLNGDDAPQGELMPAAPEAISLTLRVVAIEDTWLRIVVDAKSTQELLLLAGQERNWDALEKFVVTVGNVVGTQMYLNGASIPLQSTDNVLRDFPITKESLN